jgi:iron complex transport system substrate-binding protein
MSGLSLRPWFAAAVGLFIVGSAAGAFPALPDGVQVTDSLGRRVIVPAKVRRIISLEPEITRLIVALGAGDRLVGLDYFLRHHDRLFAGVFPEGQGLPVVSNQGQDLNCELALKLAPDVVFCSPSEAGMTESVEAKLRVPVLALASLGRLDSLLDELRLLGRVLDREERAGALEAFFRARLRSVRAVTAAISPEKRPQVYLSFWGDLARTPILYEPVDAAGGRNAAAGLLPATLGSPGTTVSIEKLIAWDPDVILIQGNYPPGERSVTVDGVLADPRLGSLRAVRNGRVHYTFGYWYWWDPALVLLETEYLAHIFSPGAFPDFDLEREGNFLYREFYGVEGAFARLARILRCEEWLEK